MLSRPRKLALKFNNTFPRADSSKLFSARNEISHVLRGGADKLLTPKILEFFSPCETKDEIIVTTYFEPVLAYEPQQSCIVRFRQRLNLSLRRDRLVFPKQWSLAGPGNLEVKIRFKNRERVTSWPPSCLKTEVKTSTRFCA